MFFSIFNMDVSHNQTSFYIGLTLYCLGVLLLFVNIVIVIWPQKNNIFYFQEILYGRLQPMIIVLLHNLQDSGYDLIYDEDFFWLHIKRKELGYLNI